MNHKNSNKVNIASACFAQVIVPFKRVRRRINVIYKDGYRTVQSITIHVAHSTSSRLADSDPGKNVFYFDAVSWGSIKRFQNFVPWES
ncbi:hypothetical protein DPMN_094608 [Dreissena polymorpha]|uniref:Uncharacterized protein n=1 Tax=Dreissena polymorpha TaxID=45954 RepID=A0A9D4L5T2_DREPO|nr:hypothetical protein DPMN_094608 [Dreissena polymorpha]